MLVLLIACANVAGLLLARSGVRTREIAIRGALGAGRGRLIRQLMTESLLLSVVGGVFGVVLAVWTMQGLLALLPEDLPRRAEVAVDAPVMLFALAVSIATGVAFGLVPALKAPRKDLHAALQNTSRASAGVHRARTRYCLVVGQVGVSLALLIAAGLLLRSLQMLLRVDPGFDPKNVLTFRLEVPFPEYTDPPGRARMYDEIQRRLATLPGVRSVGATSTLPLHPCYGMLHISIHGRGQEAVEDMPVVRFCVVSHDYFRALGIPLLKGRFLSEHDTRDAPGALIVNQAMARQFWPNEEPLGARLTVGARLTDNEPEWYEVVGVVGDVHDTTLDAAKEPYLYVPYRQLTWPQMCFVLRTEIDPRELIDPARREIAQVTGREAPFALRSLEEYVDQMIRPRRSLIILLGIFAGTAVMLAALGLYGVLSYMVAHRTQEIGVRLALGAPAHRVLRLVMYEGMVLTLVGLVVGLGAALGAARLLSGMLFGITTMDPVAFLTALAVLALVTLFACYLPARRATKVDPMVALRYE